MVKHLTEAILAKLPKCAPIKLNKASYFAVLHACNFRKTKDKLATLEC